MKKSCAVGCVVLLVAVAVLIGVVTMKAPQWWQRGRQFVLDTMAEEQRMAAFEAAWTAPSAQPDAGWTPDAVGAWRLKESAAVTGWPELNVDRAGRRATYADGARTVEVGVLAANELERPELQKRVIAAAQQGGGTTTRKTIGNGTVTLGGSGSHTTTTMGNRTHVSTSAGGHTRLWWVKGWLFVFRSRDADPAQFAEEFLKAIDATRPAEVKPGAI